MLPIYCEHFGLARQPFAVSPDPTFLYRGASHKSALAHLVYGIKARKGFVVLTGEVGTGKTMLVHSLVKELGDGHTHIACIFGLISNPNDLMRSVSDALGLPAPPDGQKNIYDYLTVLNRFLLESYQKGDDVALIIDEAQNLSAEVLENVRLLSNFETSQDKVLQILLVGQPELGERLNASQLRQLKQRVALRYNLSPLSLAECKEYMAKRLEIAGGNPSIFPDKTVETVHVYSGGIPRLINILCDNGLLAAYAAGAGSVAVAMIEDVARDLNLAVLPKRKVAAGEEAVPAQPTGSSSPASAEAESSHFADLAEAKRRVRPGVEPPAGAPTPRNEAAVGKDSRRGEAAPSRSGVGTSAPPPTPRSEPTMDEDSRRAEAVPSRFFDRLIAALTEAMGPMASVILREQIEAMGESIAIFPKRRLHELVDATSREIPSEGLRDRFRKLMSEEIGAIRPV